MHTAYVELEIQGTSETVASIYWAGPGQNYSESRVAHTRIYPRKHHYKILIGDLSRINRIRFDPSSSMGVVSVGTFIIHQYGYKPIRLRTDKELQKFEPFRRIDSLHAQRGRLFIATSSNDAQLELSLDALKHAEDPSFLGVLLRVLAVVIACAIFLRVLKPLSRDYRFVPYAMLAMVTLVFVMATTSRINAHPDEYVHVLAARYYLDHDAPPAACDNETLHTYSPYGVSRLNSLEVSYFLTGKFAGALAFLPVTESFRFRYYNVFLLSILLLMTLRSVSFRLVCLPLLATPQVWYVFSYVNSDATALFASLVAVHQAVSDDSALRRMLRGERSNHPLLRWAGLGALGALLLLSKKNFFVFDLFAGLWVILAFWLLTDRRLWIYLKRLAPALAVGAVLVGGWIYEHEAANDFSRAERIDACADRLAYSAYRSDAAPEKQHPTLYWRDRGRPFTDLFEERWGKRMFYSAVGHFGYLELLAPPTYYVLCGLLLLLLAGYLVSRAMQRGSRAEKLTMLMAIGCFALLLGLTMWKAWTKDFQPQGRYLFPMLPVVALVLAWMRKTFDAKILTAIFLLLFALSAYYFVFVGLIDIRKY